jgi:hypothetical protein
LELIPAIIAVGWFEQGPEKQLEEIAETVYLLKVTL